MQKYVSYQCTVCRRKKDLPVDAARALLNQCTITKGCAGTLQAVDTARVPRATPPVAGLEDWTPRGTTFDARPREVVEPPVDISCSASGALVLALYLPLAEWQLAARAAVTFEVRRIDSVGFNQYTFTVAAETFTVTGPDSAGLNLRFDQAAIDDDRVFVRRNGVAQFSGLDYSLTPNTVTFVNELVPGDLVSVTVYQEQNVRLQALRFTQNEEAGLSAASSWSNVRYLQPLDPSLPGQPKWFTFTAGSEQLISLPAGSRLRLKSIELLSAAELSVGTIPSAEVGERARLLTAGQPYTAKDRSYNFVVSCGRLQDQFALIVNQQLSVKKVSAERAAVEEIFPPLQLTFLPALIISPTDQRSSYINASAEISTAVGSSRLITNETNEELLPKIILGPT